MIASFVQMCQRTVFDDLKHLAIVLVCHAFHIVSTNMIANSVQFGLILTQFLIKIGSNVSRNGSFAKEELFLMM